MVFRPPCETLLQATEDLLWFSDGREWNKQENLEPHQGSSQEQGWCHPLTAKAVTGVDWELKTRR